MTDRPVRRRKKKPTRTAQRAKVSIGRASGRAGAAAGTRADQRRLQDLAQEVVRLSARVQAAEGMAHTLAVQVAVILHYVSESHSVSDIARTTYQTSGMRRAAEEFATLNEGLVGHFRQPMLDELTRSLTEMGVRRDMLPDGYIYATTNLEISLLDSGDDGEIDYI